jgi:hypothetical protein
MDQQMPDTIKATTVASDTLPGRMGIKILSASAANWRRRCRRTATPCHNGLANMG